MTALAHNMKESGRGIVTALDHNIQFTGHFAVQPPPRRNSIEAIRFRKHGGFTGKARATMVRKRR